MKKNRLIIFIVILTFLLVIPSTCKVIKNHNDSLIKVSYDKIINAGIKCFYEENCEDNEITLNELYEKGYLDKQSNPLTKEYYNELSFVDITNNSFTEVSY